MEWEECQHITARARQQHRTDGMGDHGQGRKLQRTRSHRSVTTHYQRSLLTRRWRRRRNRAVSIAFVVQSARASNRVMGFATPEQVEEFFRDVPEFERMLVRSGIILIKYWFSIA